MNQELMDMAEQATTRTSHQYQTWGDRTATHTKEDFDKEKFAELIINECLFFMAQGDVDFAKWQIKKEFGVEV